VGGARGRAPRGGGGGAGRTPGGAPGGGAAGGGARAGEVVLTEEGRPPAEPSRESMAGSGRPWYRGPMMRARLVWLLAPALLLGGARAADVGAEAARSYRIETEGSTRQLASGATGKLVLAIVPRDGTHVHPAAPLKITLSGTPGLKLSREVLGHQDAVDPGAEGPRFEVPFTAARAGAQEARARLDFFICSEQWCVKQSRDVTVAINVQ